MPSGTVTCEGVGELAVNSHISSTALVCELRYFVIFLRRWASSCHTRWQKVVRNVTFLSLCFRPWKFSGSNIIVMAMMCFVFEIWRPACGSGIVTLVSREVQCLS